MEKRRPDFKEVAMPNIDEILEGARDAMTAGRVYGDPIEQDGVTDRPAAAIGRRRRWRRRHTDGGAGFGSCSTRRRVRDSARRDPVPAVDVGQIVLYSLVALLLGGVLLRRR